MGNTARIGLALGGGAARGLAHIPMLEAFDDLGIKPSVIAGSSIGALVGAAYASGISGAELRDHAKRILSTRSDMMKHVMSSDKFRLQDFLSFGGFRNLSMDGLTLADLALPSSTAVSIEDTQIPLKIIATDYETYRERVLTSGNLREAVAASIAIPGLIAGPRIEGHIHVDGGVANPVPFDHVRDEADVTVAVEVIGKPRDATGGQISNLAIAIGSLFIMFHQQAELRRRLNPPDIYIVPEVGHFSSADFFKPQELFDAAQPAKEELKRALDRCMTAWPRVTNGGT